MSLLGGGVQTGEVTLLYAGQNSPQRWKKRHKAGLCEGHLRTWGGGHFQKSSLFLRVVITQTIRESRIHTLMGDAGEAISAPRQHSQSRKKHYRTGQWWAVRRPQRLFCAKVRGGLCSPNPNATKGKQLTTG